MKIWKIRKLFLGGRSTKDFEFIYLFILESPILLYFVSNEHHVHINPCVLMKQLCMIDLLKAVVRNLCVKTPLGVKRRLHEGRLRSLENRYLYYNS